MLSIITPAFNEGKNIPLLYDRLCAFMQRAGTEWEWIIIDDHSRDDTFEVIASLATRDAHVKGIRLSRNSGSHIALMCGLRQARGACATVLAADLQDPPEVIAQLVESWKSGSQVVWAARSAREGESRATVGFSRTYYWMMRNVVGMRDMPAAGADFFLIDRAVIDAVNQFQEKNVSLFALITWMGFRQTTIEYVKQARAHGASGWSLRKKLKLLVDSVTSFSYGPIRFMGYAGFIVALSGFAYAAVLVANRLLGRPPAGWTALMVALLVIGGLQMMMMGLLGEYLWRALDEARRRPPYLIEAMTPNITQGGAKESNA